MDCIFCRAGELYRLVEDYIILISIKPSQPAVTTGVSLTTEGLLTIHSGFHWQGPTGPTLTDFVEMRAVLIHEALQSLIKAGQLPADKFQPEIDKLLESVSVEDGQSSRRVWWI